jgi:Arm DNA-binding domain
MVRLNDTTLTTELKKTRTRQTEIVDGSVPGLAVRVGRGRAATWSLVIRVRGEGGVSRRGFQKKGCRYRITLGNYPAMSLEAARARANEFRAVANKGESPVVALERAATAGSLTVEALSERFLEDYARSKNFRSTQKYAQAIATHVIPTILENIYRGGKGDYVLSTTDGEKPIRGLAKFYQERLPRAIIVCQGAPFASPFTSHDLRRTVATMIGESLGLGGEQLVRRVLGHSDGSVTAIYNRYGYLKEMRAALEAWAQLLTQ